MLNLFCEQQTKNILLALPRAECKEKWHQRLRQTELAVQKLWPTIHRRSSDQLPGCHSRADQTIQLMLARCCGIRDIAAITGYSKDKVQGALKRFNRDLQPGKSHYDRLEVDEFWTFVGNKKNKVWLLYAYERKSGEMVAYVWGRRDIKTVRKLKEKIKSLCITYDCIATDDWRSFLQAFGKENHAVGKRHTVGIEGNNCRLWHRIKRAVRKTCCFSKKLFYHLQAFALGFFYINYDHV